MLVRSASPEPHRRRVLADRSWQRRRVPCSMSLTSEAWLSVSEERENMEVLYFLDFE